MKASMVGIIIVLVIVICTSIFMKAGVKFIGATDPLAQQIFILDNSKSPEIVKVKGELMRDLVRSYYQNRDTCIKAKK